MKNYEVYSALCRFKNLGMYGFTQADVNALQKFLQVDMNAQCSRQNMARYGFNAEQIKRQEMLVKLVTQRIEVSSDEALQKHLAKLQGRTTKTNVRNFTQEREVTMYGRLHDIPHAPWQLLNGKTVQILKSGADEYTVLAPQVVVVRRGEPLAVKGVGELIRACENSKMEMKIKADYLDLIPCYCYYQATNIPTTIDAYLCLLRTGDRYYVSYEKVKDSGKISASRADTTIGFAYGDDKLSESLYKYALLSALMREPGEGPKAALEELKAYKFQGEDSQSRLSELETLVNSEEWKKSGALAGVINIKFIPAGQTADSFGGFGDWGNFDE